MSSIVAHPIGFDDVNYSYASVDNSHPLDTAIGKDSSNTTQYAQWSLNTGSGAETYVYYLFDLSDIPANADILSVSCTAVAYIGSVSASQIAAREAQLFSGLSTPMGEPVDVQNTTDVLTLNCGTWTREQLNDCRIRLYAVRGDSWSGWTRYFRFYGATLTVEYTLPASQVPVINILHCDKSKIGKNDICTISFTSDIDLQSWEARATTNEIDDGHGVGLLVESGSALQAGEVGYVYVETDELTNGDLKYRIDIYGQSVSGVWSDE